MAENIRFAAILTAIFISVAFRRADLRRFERRFNQRVDRLQQHLDKRFDIILALPERK